MHAQVSTVFIGGWLLVGAQLAIAQSAPVTTGSALRGKEIYEARCSACHSVDAHRVGPMHWGVLGRKAGSAPGYGYSEALSKSRIIWTRATLMVWLASPEALIPGQRMGYQMDSANDREDVVAYLATLKRP